MKFKDDMCGWRDLKVADSDNAFVSASIYTDDPSIKPFIHVVCGDEGATFGLSRKKLRKFAEAIIKELDE